MSCRMKSDRQMVLKRGRIPDTLLVTNKVSPRLAICVRDRTSELSTGGTSVPVTPLASHALRAMN
jgi:hypothetical protein